MTARRLGLAALWLWALSALGLGHLYVNGRVTAAPDGRETVQLGSGERELVLAEMRTMLESVRGVAAGLAEDDLGAVRRAARVSGVAMGANVPPATKARLPRDFRRLGMSVHRHFDELAAAAREESTRELMARLSEQLGRCVACHRRYRFGIEAVAADAGETGQHDLK